MMVARLVLVALTAVLAVGATRAAAITGEAALAAIRDAMVAAGVDPPEMSAPMRDLPDCDHAPRVGQRGQGWAVAELSCDTPSWSRLFRTGAPTVQMSAQDRRRPDAAGAPMMTLVRPVPRGGRIMATDLMLGEFSGIDPAQAIRLPEQAIGRRLRVAMGPGQPLLERHLDPVQDIEPGQQVAVHVQTGAIMVSHMAVAVTGGRVGELVRLETPDGAKRIEAIILSPGTARVMR